MNHPVVLISQRKWHFQYCCMLTVLKVPILPVFMILFLTVFKAELGQTVFKAELGPTLFKAELGLSVYREELKLS